jgi:imidazolonepropionase-like amidohydrolase
MSPWHSSTASPPPNRSHNSRDEIRWLARAGLPAEAALGAGSWTARRWLGLTGLEQGTPTDVGAYPADPRRDLAVLDHPARIVLRGRIVR